MQDKLTLCYMADDDPQTTGLANGRDMKAWAAMAP